MIKDEIVKYLSHLSKVYDQLGGAPLKVSFCGGAALLLIGAIDRPTQDVDVVSPESLPHPFLEARNITAEYFGLKEDWINQGPIDLLKMGLPQGYFERCQILDFGHALSYLVASRFDQIHFKLYASVDRGGYHVEDLKKLNPSAEELVSAARWCLTHDVSEEFKSLLLDFLKLYGWMDAVRKLA